MSLFASNRILKPLAVALLLLSALSGCDRARKALHGGPDLRWQSDSSLLATNPSILYRLVPYKDTLVKVMPVATIGTSGLRKLHMGGRGWRAFDVQYLQSTSQIFGVRNGRAAAGLTIKRGMWEPTPFDTTVKCDVPIPTALGMTTDKAMWIASSEAPKALRYSTELSAAELQNALESIPLLIAPTAGVSIEMLRKYERRVHQVPSGSGPTPSLVVEFNDPEHVPDSLPAMGQRPRQLIVVLDKGVYGYKPSWTYKTVGNRGTEPRLRFLDYIDVNGDGLAELVFGLSDYPLQPFTLVMRFETDAWRDYLKDYGRFCE